MKNIDESEEETFRRGWNRTKRGRGGEGDEQLCPRWAERTGNCDNEAGSRRGSLKPAGGEKRKL